MLLVERHIEVMVAQRCQEVSKNGHKKTATISFSLCVLRVHRIAMQVYETEIESTHELSFCNAFSGAH